MAVESSHFATSNSLDAPAAPSVLKPDLVRPAAWTLASFLLTSLLPVLNRSRLGDISNWYSDHVHHAFVTWVAVAKGWAIYTHPFSELWDNSGFPFEVHGWGDMPLVYPPGVLAVFLPTALLGRFVPMSPHTFGVLSIEFLLLLAHGVLWAVLVTLGQQQQGSRATTLMVVWVCILTLALEGFYDPLFIGAGAMVAYQIREGRPEAALRWFSVAALLHFRAAVFAPLGIYALWQLIRRRRAQNQNWPWKTLAGLGVSLALCAATFLMMYPATFAFRSTHPPVLPPESVAFWVVLLVTLAVATACFYLADAAVACMVLTTLLLCILERQNFWWHGAIVLAPLLAVSACKTARHASAARAILIGWGLTLYPVIWGGAHVMPLFWALSIGFKPAAL